MTVLDPQKILNEMFGSEHRRLVSYAEADAGQGTVVGVLVYDSSFDPFDDPTARVTRRAKTTMNAEGVGGSDIIVSTWYVDKEAYQRQEQERMNAQEAVRKRDRALKRQRVRAHLETSPELVERSVCSECGYVGELGEFEERLYECGSCGTIGRGDEGRQCESCHKFAAKVAELSCPSCEEGLESAETVEGYEVDGEFVSAQEAAT